MVNCDSCEYDPICNLLKGGGLCQYYRLSLKVMLNRILKSTFIVAIGIVCFYYMKS